MSWIPTPQSPADPSPDFDRVLSLLPELHGRYREFEALFWERRLVEPVLLELCRLRVAQLLECRSELARRHPAARAAGLREERIEALPRWRQSPRFSSVERACLALVEKFVFDPHGVSDAEMEAVVSALGNEGAVALAEALALFDGFGRFRNALGIESGEERSP